MQGLKNRSYKRYNGLISLLLLFISLCSFPLTANAYSGTGDTRKPFYVSYSEPSTDTGNGYVNFLLKHRSTGQYYVSTVYFNCMYTDSSSGSLPVSGQFTITSQEFQFVPYASSISGAKVNYSCYMYDPAGCLVHLKTSSTDSCSYNFYNIGFDIIGWQAHGDVVIQELVMNANDGGAMFKVVYVGGLDGARFEDYLSQILSGMNALSGGFGDVGTGINYTLTQIYGQIQYSLLPLLNNIYNNWTHVFSSMDGNIYKLVNLLTDVDNRLIYYLDVYYNKLVYDIIPSLDSIEDKLSSLVEGSSEDNSVVDNFQEESAAQSDNLNNLNEQNQTEKVDINSAVSDVDSNINYDNMAQYGGVLATITNNEYVLQLILVVVSIAIISYVLFGKR